MMKACTFCRNNHLLAVASIILAPLAAGAAAVLLQVLRRHRQKQKWHNRSSTASELRSLLLLRTETAEADLDEGGARHRHRHRHRQYQSWKDIPVVVQNYFRTTFHQHDHPKNKLALDGEYAHRVLTFEQHGLIKNNQKKWLNFVANQIMSGNSSNLGFVWEAKADLLPLPSWIARFNLLPSIHVVDAWVKNTGHLLVSLGGVIPIVTDRSFRNHRDELRRGEQMRYLAETFLIPSVLLPSAGVVKWEAVVPDDPKAAVLSLIEPHQQQQSLGPTTTTTTKMSSLRVTFVDEDTVEIRGDRPAADGAKGFVDKPWIGWMSRYQTIHGIRIPTHMECGWICETDDDDTIGTSSTSASADATKVDLYFKADNTSWQIMERGGSSSQKSATTVKQE